MESYKNEGLDNYMYLPRTSFTQACSHTNPLALNFKLRTSNWMIFCKTFKIPGIYKYISFILRLIRRMKNRADIYIYIYLQLNSLYIGKIFINFWKHIGHNIM